MGYIQRKEHSCLIDIMPCAMVRRREGWVDSTNELKAGTYGSTKVATGASTLGLAEATSTSTSTSVATHCLGKGSSGPWAHVRF